MEEKCIEWLIWLNTKAQRSAKDRQEYSVNILLSNTKLEREWKCART